MSVLQNTWDHTPNQKLIRNMFDKHNSEDMSRPGTSWHPFRILRRKTLFILMALVVGLPIYLVNNHFDFNEAASFISMDSLRSSNVNISRKGPTPNPSRDCPKINPSRDCPKINPSRDCPKINSSTDCPEMNPSRRCPKTDPDNVLAVDHRRRLAATIASIQRELQRLAGTEAVIDAKWPLKLAAVAAELDPRMNSPTNSSWEYSARLSNMGPAPQLENRTRHVCPEVYHIQNDSSSISPNTMEPEDCTYVPKFSSVLTIVLPALNWEHNTTNFVVKQIRKHYDIPIIAIVSLGDNIDKNIKNVTVLEQDNNNTETESINTAVKRVKTPYVYIGKALTHFDERTSLERLVRVLDELEHVKVAGGAARDLQGHWIHGCLQQRMANYQAYYAMGYYYSKYECMYCDDLLTPFVTTTKLMNDIQLTTGLSGPATYRDWFAKVRQKGHLTMACPDVMFYVRNHVTMSKEDWLMVGKQWALEKVHSYDNQLYSFTCDSVGISCAKPLDIIRSYLLPPCCRALMEKYLPYLTEFGKDNNISYELHAGSALGALKMGGYLPWDFDMDIYFICKDYKKWITIDKKVEKIKCHVKVMQNNKYITVFCPHFFLELYCHDKMTAQYQLPVEYRSIPTSIRYAGRDLNVIANPGLYSRRKMGFEDLKHAAHWRTLEVSNAANAKGGYQSPGTWNHCKDPKHHSCLDHYPGDGNLPFLEPFLLL